MNLNYKIEKALIESNIRNQNLIVAVSGGIDSQVLLKSFPHVAKKFNINCIAVGINHGLRSEAESELNLAKELAVSMDIPYHSVNVVVDKGASIQAQARNARYNALYEMADKYDCKYVTTAHHFDDRAETVFIRLLRGKNIGSMGVLPLISGRIFRPMLRVNKKEIMGYCKRWNLKYANDPSNDNTNYLRVKIRKEIMPMLESINPQIKNRLNEIADELLINKN